MKKVLSLVLVLALVLGSFSMAFAAETTETNLSDIAGNANEGAIVVANDLGVVTGYPDGTFKPTATVTRAEFAAMMTRALAIPESALKGFKTSSFKDVASDHWAVAYLGYCNSKGIMTGYEDGTARPNQTITVNEAMTMICRALGYTNQAKELVGSWPANYIALAQQLDLYDDVEATAVTDRASAAQIIYNALDEVLVYIDADGATKPQSGNPSMLRNLGGIEFAPAGGAAGDEFILTTDLARSASIDCMDKVGCLVTAFAKKTSPRKIIAIEEQSTTITGTFKNADNSFKLEDGTEYIFKATSFTHSITTEDMAASGGVPALVANGQCDATVSGGGIVDGDYTLAVDITKKTITDVYSVFTWAKADMSKYEEGDLDTKDAELTVGGTYKFEKDKNGDIDTSKFILEGVSSLNKIAVDNVVEVYLDKMPAAANSRIVKISVGTKTVTGECTEINKNLTKYTIDGVKYELTDGIAANDIPEVGQAGTAYLTYDGKIAYWDVNNGKAGNYAIYLKSLLSDSSTIASSITKAGLTTKDNKTTEYDMASGYVTKAGLTEGMLVEYSVNSAGKINCDLEKSANWNTSTGAVNKARTTFDNVDFASNVVVFLKDSDGDWSVGSVGDLKTSADGNITLQTITYKGKLAAVAGVKDDVTSKDTPYAVINSVTKATNGDDKTWKLYGFVDGKELNNFTDKNGTDPGYTPSIKGLRGGLYELEMDAQGVVTKVTTIDNTNYATKLDSGASTVLGKVVKSVGTTAGKKYVETTDGKKYDVSDNVIVYYFNSDDEYEILALNQLKNKNVDIACTDSDLWKDTIYTIIFAWD